MWNNRKKELQINFNMGCFETNVFFVGLQNLLLINFNMGCFETVLSESEYISLVD